MTWTSETHQFGDEEMRLLEVGSAEDLAPALLQSDPLVLLRAVAEIRLHEGDGSKRLRDVLTILGIVDQDRVAELGRRCSDDGGWDSRDEGYLAELRRVAASWA